MIITKIDNINCKDNNGNAQLHLPCHSDKDIDTLKFLSKIKLVYM